MSTAPVQYARSSDVNIAFQVTGAGPFDLVLIHGFFSHLEIDWELPASRYVIERLGSFARLIRFDKRGTGLSDRNVGLPDLETRMDDVRVVMDAVGSESAALFGYSEGGPMCGALRRDVPEAGAGARPLRHLREAPRSRWRLPVGADVGRACCDRGRARGDVGRERGPRDDVAGSPTRRRPHGSTGAGGPP